MSLPSHQSSIHGGAVAVRGPLSKVGPASAARPARGERLSLFISAPIIVTVSLALWTGIITAIGKLLGWL